SKAPKKKKKKTSMSFFTALSLSLNNLLTKKARTILTSFAGSIGIIGIALILALSNGIQTYIDSVQEETLSSYPISIEKETMDMGSMLEKLRGVRRGETGHERDAVYSASVMYELLNAMSSSETTTNNLRDFKKFVDMDEDIQKYLTAVQYTYKLALNIYTEDTEGNIVKSDMEELMRSLVGASAGGKETAEEVASGGSIMGSWANMATSTGLFRGMDVWEELLPGEDGKLTAELQEQQYELLAGRWPTAFDELVLIVDENNEVSDMCLYALGLKTRQEMAEITLAAMNQEKIEIREQKWSYDDIMAMTFRAIPGCDFYQYDEETKTYRDIGATETGLKYLYDNALTLKVSGIVRQSGDNGMASSNGAIGYTAALVDYMIRHAAESDVVKAQQASPDVDVLSGFAFENEEVTLTDAQKAEAIVAYYEGLNIAQKAAAFVEIQSRPADDYVSEAVEQYMQGMTREAVEGTMTEQYAQETGLDLSSVREYVKNMDDETLFALVRDSFAEQVREGYAAAAQAQLGSMTSDQLAAALERTLAAVDESTLAQYYDLYLPRELSDSTYDENLRKLSYVDMDDPDGIELYVNTFENKDFVADRIAAYNDSVKDEDRISYTDYVALLMSSITTIINAISYVLIAFVAISLVVSSIMIGIITYISVLERTKEIGVLRSIGASKRDVSRVFNAETLIVGLVAGILGIAVTLLLCWPLNAIVHALTGIETLSAILPWQSGIVLVIISMLLTVIAGLIPARIAAKKDPVVALRSE
ncbi:MAG: ABC transporter permease, partial [Clostridia bacterium]|nr:ABC transporter permease [Clostridia bacterium]